MLELRITNTRGSGSLRTSTWRFDPLGDPLTKPGYFYKRKGGRSAGGTFRTKAVFRQRVFVISFGADTLGQDAHWNKFIDMLQASKLEIKETVANKTVWTEIGLDIDEELEPDRLEEIRELPFVELKFFESVPEYHNKWYK